MSAASNETEDLSFEFLIDEPPAKLWRALTEPAIVERWLAPVAPATAPYGPGLSCQVLSVQPGRSVSYLWRDAQAGESTVTFAISEREDGLSRLSVFHRGLARQAVAVAGDVGCTMMLGAARPRPLAANAPCPALAPAFSPYLRLAA